MAHNLGRQLSFVDTDLFLAGVDEESRRMDLRSRASRIPFNHSERLIALGLPKLSLGRLDLTIPGRQIVEVTGRP